MTVDRSDEMLERYRVTTDVHRNIRTAVTISSGAVVHLYTDSHGVLREMRNGEGHPILSGEVAAIFTSMPETAGWKAVQVSPEEESSLETEIVPVQHQPDAALANSFGGGGTLASRVRELIETVAAQESVIANLRKREFELEEQLAQATRPSELLLSNTEVPPDGLGVNERPAAPMVEQGRVVPAKAAGRGRGRPTTAASASELVDRDALDDIPGTLGTNKNAN